MKELGFPDVNITHFTSGRELDSSKDVNQTLQMHSSLVRRLSLDKELEGHQGCVNAVAWNSKGSLLVSGSDDAQINIWSYANQNLLHSIDTGHSANIFCTKFIPETGDELVASGAGDREVRVFRVSHSSGRSPEERVYEPSALFRCHTRRVKKLAVEAGNPNVVWSASEDGTLRQHDFRECVSCPPSGSADQECRNVLLDLRCGAKRSLTDSPRHCLALKSCDISSTRPHQILVGGSDSFARLYDRRMLPPLSSCQKRTKPPPCVNYFCPMHLADHGRLHLTHVTFSPNGEEVLLSYSGEHVYLMDVNVGGDSVMKYRASDIPKRMVLAPLPNGTEILSLSHCMPAAFCKIGNGSRRLHACHELLQAAKRSLEAGSDLVYAIDACTEVLDGKGPEIGSTLKHDCLCTRASLFVKRQWKNDLHMAIRDCNRARGIDPSSFQAHFNMAEALLELGRHTEALDYAHRAQLLAPNSEVAETLRENILAAEAEKNNKNSDGTTKAEERSKRVRSLSELLYRSEVENSDTSQDGPRSEREDSDYDEEMGVELDFETSVSGDEGRETEPRILRGSLNLRFHNRGDSGREDCSTNGSCGSPSSSPRMENTSTQPEVVIDMKQRYVGHCNVGTDIKQASFLGRKGEYVASGSDDGRWFIWEKRTGRLVKMLAGDENVVNCVQCHPFDCCIATSGIDNTIKIWSPFAQAPSVVAGGTAGPETTDVLSAMESNQHKMRRNREIGLPFEILERLRMHEFTEGTIHPFECTQS
ncbi:WD and tetratricopeptide repeats protein 1 isoform X1 [Amborella trichopoda]|uniref:WD and tetratricopeptide repeats protein 1 isoform X1 n=1 Tax=Amborella trichopoda TaxID=13333 RepID=UPI0005D2EC8B|nr:WD and tetratricopeptide repeats protein 1 isoform X1 [Amborella trichopoda]|eukprot:XP_011622171.1 WD and tetratricopeptide repeats protein 1 isoform X1 [Amborella trichopoda]